MKLILPVVYSINGCGTGQSQTISHLQMHQIYQIHIPQPRFWHILATFLGLDHWSTMVLTHSYRIVTSSVPWGPGDVRIQIWSAIAWWHVPMMAHPRCSRRAFRMCPWRIQAVKSLKGSKGYLWWRDVTCRSNIFFWEYVCGWLWVPLWVRLRHDQAIAVAETVLEGSRFHKSAIASSKLMQIVQRIKECVWYSLCLP